MLACTRQNELKCTGQKPFLTLSCAGAERAGGEFPIWNQSRTSLKHRKCFSGTNPISAFWRGPAAWINQSMAGLSPDSGVRRKWRKCHPSFPERQVGQGNQFPCFSTGEWFILLAVVCSAVQKRRCCQGTKPFWSISRKGLMRPKHLSIDTSRFAQPLVEFVWSSLVWWGSSKNLSSKSEGGVWTGMQSFCCQKKKKNNLKLWLAKALSFLRIYPEGIQVIVSWMH